jgi:membrane dipeptidase
MTNETLDARIDRLHATGLVDMHYDLLMDLYEKRNHKDVLGSDYLADLRMGGVGVLAAAIYIEDKYLPEMGLRVALDQIARLYAEVDANDQFAICKSYSDIVAARKSGKIALLIAMEGVEPLGTDINLLRIFYELGVRDIGLTHARRNMAGDGGIFASNGSSPQGLTRFGREVVRECERLGILIDLAHINPAGFDDVMAMTTKPVIVSHTNARHYYDIERNISDEQIKAIGARNGVIGVNAVLVSPRKQDSHLDRYVDHIEYLVELAGVDNIGIGFDFFEKIWNSMPAADKEHLNATLAPAHFIPDLSNHSHARNLTHKLIERGFDDEDIARILYGNWMRIFKQLI